MWKNRFYSFINVFGLSIGLATCMLIFMYIRQESSYDRFHEDGNRIFRLNLNFKIGEHQEVMPYSTRRLAPMLVEKFPEVEESLRIEGWKQPIVGVEKEGEWHFFHGNHTVYSDANFFRFFSFPLLVGDSDSVLDHPDQVVISEKKAIEVFGPTTDLSALVGKTLAIGAERKNYKLSGIAANAPENSHIKFDVLLPFKSLENYDSSSWINNQAHSYVKLSPDIAGRKERIEELEENIAAIVAQKVTPEFENYTNQTYQDFLAAGNVYEYAFIPLTQIHLRSGLTEELEQGGSIYSLYFFGALALFVMVLACVNFMNLSTARSADRAREVGIRKALGSVKSHLARQFLLESILYSLLALVLAFLIADAVLPLFMKITGIRLSTPLHDPQLIVLSVLFSILVGLGAGIYPAVYLTHFEPAQVLKGKTSEGIKSGIFRNVLVVFQFSISITLIICTLIVQQQLEFMRNQYVGFQKENVVVVKNASMLGEQAQVMKQKIKSHPVVENASFSNNVPGDIYLSSTAFRKGEKAPEASMEIVWADDDYLSTLGVEMEKGRFFQQDIPSDSNAIVINEVAARFLEGEKVLGEEIDVYTRPSFKHRVVGIMKDFNFSGLQETIKPMGILYEPVGDLLNVRLKGNPEQGLEAIEEEWREMAPGVPFEYSFLDQHFDTRYRNEQQMVKVMSLFTFIAIAIACLGLFGLASFTAERRNKEIGIRKVLGASTWEVVFLLTRDFTRLVLLSFLIAVPVAFIAMHQWLNNFAYKMSIGAGVFIVSGLLALGIAWLTVSYQSFRAALSEPVDSLKEE